MKHLTDMELEELTRAAGDEANEHLAECADCRGRLAEKRALSQRVRGAFESVHVSEDFKSRIASHLQAGHIRAQKRLYVRNAVHVFLHRLVWPGAAAAAIAMIVLVGIYTLKPSEAEAARAELVSIHETNVAGHEDFHTTSDPAGLAAYFKEKLGFVPSLPEAGKGMALRGCCVRNFKDQVVGSYVVDTPQGVMSIVVVSDLPKSLGMVADAPYKGYTFWRGDFASSNMVTVRLGGYSYCAVGEVSHAYLIDLLVRLLPDAGD